MKSLKKTHPKVNVFNRQRKLDIPIESLRDFLRRISERLAVGGFFSVVLVSDMAMTQYHLKFLGINQPTDVLAFPNEQDEWETGEIYLGDILISVETANHQKCKNLLEELQILSLHGLLHLLGYDHHSDQGEMELMENKLRKEFLLQ